MRHLASLVALLAAGLAVATAPARSGAAACQPLDTTGEPTNGRSEPPPAPAYFAADFPTLADSGWGFRIGGFGGLKRHARLHHTPVVFVHGNQVDAPNWLDPMLQFQNPARHSL